MATYTQVSNAVNEVINSIYGNVENAVVDGQKVLELGEVVATVGVDVVFKKLLDRVGRLVVDEKTYIPNVPDLAVNPTIYGNIIEKIRFKRLSLMDSESLNDDFRDGKQFSAHVFYQPEIMVKFWHDKKPIDVRVSYPKEQLKSAFSTPDEMTKFASGLSVAVENTFSSAYEAIVHTIFCSAIATVVKSNEKNGNFQVVNLLSLFNENLETPLTVEQALKNKDFLRFCSLVISKYKKLTGEKNSLCNDGTFETFTTPENARLVLLNDFSLSLETNLLSDTFNKEFVSLDNFSTLNSWMAVKSNASAYDFETLSQIKVSNVTTVDTSGELSKSSDTVTLNNIVGVLCDTESLVTSNKRLDTTIEYTHSGRFWTSYYTEDCTYMFDTSETFIVFTLN